MKKILLTLVAFLTLSLSTYAQTEATAKCGETVVITATADPGYKFLYWDDDHANTNPVREITVSSDLELLEYQAVFEKEDYTITVAVKEAGTGSVKATSVSGGLNEVVTLEAVESNKCYKFSHWEDAEGKQLSTDIKYSYTIKASTTVYAVFAERDFTVKVSAQTGGTVVISKK